MWLKLEEKGSRPIFRGIHKTSHIFYCFQVLKTVENLEFIQNIWNPIKRSWNFAWSFPVQVPGYVLVKHWIPFPMMLQKLFAWLISLMSLYEAAAKNVQVPRLYLSPRLIQVANWLATIVYKIFETNSSSHAK